MYKVLFKISLCFIFHLLLVKFLLAQEHVKVYLANDDHTDFFWSANADTYHKVFLETLDYYLNLADETENDPDELQSRWNCDGSYWMWTYEKNRSPEQFERLVSRIKDGHISFPLNALAVCLGATPTEGVLRGMYYPGKIARQYGIEFPLAYQVENQTLSYGLGSLWAGAGAKYSWVGVCGCDTRVTGLNKRENYIYWWLGPDSSRILTKWYPLLNGNSKSLGGYAEARDLWEASALFEDTVFFEKYPYKIIGLFGKGWDDLETMTREFSVFSQFESSDKVKYIVSNEIDFFEDFEKTYGTEIPEQSVGFGNEWELYTSYMQETTSTMLRSIEGLRGAEALASLVSLNDGNFMEKYTASRDSAWMNIGLFWEHDWGMDHREYFVPERIKWQKGIAAQVKNYVELLYSDAKDKLGELIKNTGQYPRYYVFNALGHERDDFADLAYNGKFPVRVIDVTTGEEAPFQKIDSEDGANIRIWSTKIPSVGYKVYEIQQGESKSPEAVEKWDGELLETPFYKVRFGRNGAIRSLVDKKSGKEWSRIVNGRTLNDLGQSENGTISLENNGSVSATIKIQAPVPLKHITYITFYRNSPRIDIRNEITENFEGNYDWAFGFNIELPEIWHEEVGAVVKAGLYENGGYLSSRNARYDWLTIGHFADISDGKTGITISSPDCNFMQLGNSSIEQLDTITPQIKILAGANSVVGAAPKPYIRNQGGESYFVQRFALIPHGEFRKVDAMRFSLEHQNPLICGAIQAGDFFPEDNYSLIQIDNPNVLLWALKPAEEGFKKEGLVARAWNMSSKEEDFMLTSERKIITGKKLNHIEVPKGNCKIMNNKLEHRAEGQQIVTFSFTMN